MESHSSQSARRMGHPGSVVVPADSRFLTGLSARFGMAKFAAYSENMRQSIKVDNSRPMTVYDTARVLGVSKKRTEEIIREIQRMIHRDPKTGKIAIRTNRRGKTAGSHSSRSHGFRNGTKTSKRASARRNASR